MNGKPHIAIAAPLAYGYLWMKGKMAPRTEAGNEEYQLKISPREWQHLLLNI